MSARRQHDGDLLTPAYSRLAGKRETPARAQGRLHEFESTAYQRGRPSTALTSRTQSNSPCAGVIWPAPSPPASALGALDPVVRSWHGSLRVQLQDRWLRVVARVAKPRLSHATPNPRRLPRTFGACAAAAPNPGALPSDSGTGPSRGHRYGGSTGCRARTTLPGPCCGSDFWDTRNGGIAADRRPQLDHAVPLPRKTDAWSEGSVRQRGRAGHSSLVGARRARWRGYSSADGMRGE